MTVLVRPIASLSARIERVEDRDDPCILLDELEMLVRLISNSAIAEYFDVLDRIARLKRHHHHR